MSPLPIDLDAEAIQFDGLWFTREELARRIKQLLDSGDFAVSRPSQALEALTVVLASLRTLAFRATPELADTLAAAAAQQGKTASAVIRDALGRYLGLPMPGPDERPAPGARAVPPSIPPNLAAVQPAAKGHAPADRPHGAERQPSVVVDKSVLAEEPSPDAKGEARKKDDDTIERRWFGA